MENVLPEHPAEKRPSGYVSTPPPGAGGPLPDAGIARLRLAGWWRRAGAAVIDGVVVGAPAALVLALIVSGVDAWLAAVALTVFVWVPCVLVMATLYAPALMARTNGATPGKAALGIRVARIDGEPMTFKRAFVREALLKWGLFYCLGGILTFGILPLADVLWPLWDEEHRALHDLPVRTRVIRD
ncbi:MAG TPA: RDD family protein [Solirubrobacter sp.]|nr:RDD family protein [Solirubrobacter sp.]